ncbi:tail fiber domain-containing protein, partial [bacterium]|nr:tail fiber domain-containing protein [bacterium]
TFTYTTETAGAGTGQTLYTINVPSGGVVCDILIVGGGGTGGGDQGGGGGGGGLVYITSENLAAGTYNIRVGRGGQGISVGTNDGKDSSLGNYIANGGGGGGFYTSTSTALGRSGGCGGGGGAPQFVLNAAGGSSTQQTYTGRGFGNIGGTASANTSVLYCGGGGGAGETGVNGTNTAAGRGGNGRLINITGQNVYYAGGGGGSIRAGAGVVGGLGGLGGGGNGTQDDITVSNPPNGNSGKNALPNTGGGGGGVSRGEGIPGGNGGSGIVIIRYVSSQTSSTIELLRGNSTDSNIDYKIGNYSGDFKIISSTSSVDTDYIRITSDGASIYNPTGSPQWSTVSDRRIKENIEKASYDKCYDNINKLELYRFNYIKELKNINKDLKQLGYIAQDVQDIFPKAVSMQEFNNDNLSIADMLSIDI